VKECKLHKFPPPIEKKINFAAAIRYQSIKSVMY